MANLEQVEKEKLSKDFIDAANTLIEIQKDRDWNFKEFKWQGNNLK
jgi:hypothetical protein